MQKDARGPVGARDQKHAAGPHEGRQEEVARQPYHDLELAVPLLRLPRRDEVQHVHALMGLALLLALLAAQLYAARREERPRGGRVDHFDESGVKINFRR